MPPTAPPDCRTHRLLALCLCLGFVQIAWADEPGTRQQDQIRQVLTGDPAVAEDSKSATGDAVLDGVLEVIRKRGSILDGSSLEQPIEPDLSILAGGREVAKSPAATSRRAYVAEQLLKTSRLLESLGIAEPEPIELISAMRSAAAKLLRE
jgi:hypothetical protein